MAVRTFPSFINLQMKKKQKPQAPRLSADVLQRVRDRAEQLATTHGLVVRDVTFGPTDLGLTLSVVLASADDNALSIADCEMVSRPLAKELDDLLDDRTPPYMFEVTSAGVEPVEMPEDDNGGEP